MGIKSINQGIHHIDDMLLYIYVFFIPFLVQLIDLSSPLIKWSPEDKENTENESPLIDFSELSF